MLNKIKVIQKLNVVGIGYDFTAKEHSSGLIGLLEFCTMTKSIIQLTKL